MRIFINLLPIFVFVAIFLTSGIYYSSQGISDAFYQIPAAVAVLPSIIVAWIINKDKKTLIYDFLTGAGHRDIIGMCIIFLLAGALGHVTNSIGSVKAIVNFTLSLTPQNLLLVAVFITAGIISTVIGTSMGTIATLAPIVFDISNQGCFSPYLGAGSLVGGAMFGDNLSLISDTTIASVSSQNADLIKKMKFNARLVLLPAIITIIILSFSKTSNDIIHIDHYNIILLLPYLFLILLALLRINVLLVLLLSLFFSGSMGLICSDYTIANFTQDVSEGFRASNDIIVLCIFLGGLSGLVSRNTQNLSEKILRFSCSSKRVGRLLIASIVSISDILLANNVIAIILSGKLASKISTKYKITSHETASLLDIFSCVFQGIIPYGAQILLVSSIMQISPIDIMSKVYYCYIVGIVSILYILIRSK